MTERSPILDYVTPQPAPRRLALDESGGSVRVIFPVAPKWVYMFPIVMAIVVGCAKLVGGIVLARMMWQLASVPGSPVFVPLRRVAIWYLLEWSGVALIWWTFAAYEWRMYFRWGRVPRILAGSRESLTFSRLGLWRMRERKWRADQITTVEFRPVKGNLNWRRTVADLYIRRREGRRLHFRLSSPDSELPANIARALARVLGCEFVHFDGHA